MNKPPIPANLLTDFTNGNFTGAPRSLLAMILISTALIAAYLIPAALFRRGFPKSMDLAFALALAQPITSLIVMDRMDGGLITGGIALVIGLLLWGSARSKPSEHQSGNAGRIG
jgi:hypothetical protein